MCRFFPIVNLFWIFPCQWSHFSISHGRCSVTKGVFRNFAKFTRKHLRQSLFFNKVAGCESVRHATLLKKRLVQVFSCQFCEIFKSTFLQNTYGRLLLALQNNNPIPIVWQKCQTRKDHIQNQQIHWDVWNSFVVHRNLSDFALCFGIIVNFQWPSPKFASNIKQI